MPTPPPDWTPHAASLAVLVIAIIGILLTVIGFLLRQGLADVLGSIKKLDLTITKLFEKYNNHEHRLSVLEGSHESRTRLKISCALEEK